jgi:hypothetical protein
LSLRFLDDLNLFTTYIHFSVLFPIFEWKAFLFCLTYTFLRALPSQTPSLEERKKKKKKPAQKAYSGARLCYVCFEGCDTTHCSKSPLIVDALSNHTAHISKTVSEREVTITQKTAWLVPLNPPNHSAHPTVPHRRCRPESPGHQQQTCHSSVRRAWAASSRELSQALSSS